MINGKFKQLRTKDGYVMDDSVGSNVIERIKEKLLNKSKKVPVGTISSSGKSKKVAEGKWVKVTASRKNLPKKISSKVYIPPAWTDVQYFSDPKSKLLVTGVDAAGRVQYLYNPEYVTAKAKEKFARANALNKLYDTIVKENIENMKSGLPEAECLALILDTGIRPGSEKDTKAKVDAYGASTIEGRHVVKTKNGVTLQFIGKKGIPLNIPVTDPVVAKMLLKNKNRVEDNERVFNTNGDKLRLYTISLGNNAGFSSKEFRTHLGTAVALKERKKIAKPTTMSEYKKAVNKIAKAVAKKLGNTPRVAMQSYINPAIFENWRRNVETT